MRVIYNGYAIMTYGPTHLSISDKEGKIIFTTTNRQAIISTETETELKTYLKQYLKDHKHAD